MSAGLLAGLLGAPAAIADEVPVQPPVNVRQQIVDYWETGGAGLKLAAEQALLGGDEGIRKFLDEAQTIQNDDNRIETARMIMGGGPAVRTAAKAAWFTSPAALEEFLLTGYVGPLDEDRKVDISRMVTLGGPGVRDAGKAALQGTFDDREEFLNHGQYEARKDDNRVEAARLTNTGGANVKAAAKAALKGTPEDIVEFLEVGQFTARNRDQVHASIADLTTQAKEAGKQAEDATKTAEEASAKAIAASNAAKEAAKKAAAETQAAKDDAQRAAVKAKQAAAAARAAADAAQVAIGSANAASRAARRAALAASQTASAAASAADAANKAYNAAIAAAGNAGEADNANKAASTARAAAQLAKQSAAAAEQAGKASAAAGAASEAAKDASTNANEAADAAEDANDYADQAGLHSDEARRAAVEARRHANAASAAADRSAALARRAATLAYGARDAANSAAAHAENAANFAEEAARQAGNSAAYAAQARAAADAAKTAAQTATDAVTKAQEIFDLAKETEAADLLTRTEAAIERARSRKATSEAQVSASAAAQLQALSLNDTATALAAEAGRPDVNVQATAAKGRQLAMQAMKSLGPWHKEAAARALAGTDQEVLDYLRTRWKEANEHDLRQRVVHLSTQSPYASVCTAATEALKGTPEQIQGFYSSGQYAAGLDDMKVDVARYATTGGPGVKEAAKAALAEGTGKALATFLNITQYAARMDDEKVLAAQLATTGGAEVKAAAKIALAGPPELLHEFVATGRYMAQRKDDLAANHNQLVESLLAEGRQVAAKAQENHWRAAEAAARATQAELEATAAAAEAQKSAEAAARYAANAKASADQAAQSAAAAANSATTARNAANRAEQDATAAENSAAEAAFSAAYARQSARAANDSATKARESALAAGKSKEAAENEAMEAWKAVQTLREREEAEARRQAEEERKRQQNAEPKRVCVPHPTRETMAPIMACALDPENSRIEIPLDPTLNSIVWELTGANGVKECIQNPAGSTCVMAAVGVLPWGKWKLLTKIDNGIDYLKHTRATRRTVTCLTSNAPQHSFPVGTQVLMGDGSGKPIEQIQAGDLVTATDPTTGVTGPRTVTRTIHTPDDRNFTDVTLTDGSSVTSTDGHAYWVENRKRWIDARDLRVGDGLRTPLGTTVEVSDTRRWTSLQPAYDLTVDDLHTYYVSTGTTDVLVHNTDESCPPWAKKIMDELGDSPHGKATGGRITDGKGNNLLDGEDAPEEFTKPQWSGKGTNTDLLADLDEFIKASPDFPDKKNWKPYSYEHTETKFAMLMRNHGVKEASVTINKNYVCDVASPGMGCLQTVAAILPRGWKMKIYYPGKGSPETIVGISDVPLDWKKR
ncbi:polymorphic toxin-type HINT domain-containing protein [Streptomyces lavendulocolor]|uniref:polymorphic toxin-type HINT domain-containing protein n=1 Tax=Streptomyces lavendulocolor TaxID=67316 RepID=UPI003C2BBADE